MAKGIKKPPRSLPDTIIDIGLRHQIYLERVAADLSQQLRIATAEFLQQVTRWVREQEAELTDLSATQLRSLLLEAKKEQIQALLERADSLMPQFAELADYESAFTARALEKMSEEISVKVLDAGKAYKEALANPVSATGDRFSDFLDGWAEKEVDAIDRLVSKGYTQGWTNDEIATAIRGTKAAEYADGLAPRLAANADTIVRTSVMHVANTAMEMTWAANSDIIEEEQVVATLDSRTTPGCRFLDGRRYPLGKGPSFPRHYNCRTIKVPVLNAQFAFLEEGSTRASATGQVDANLTYYSWLKTQGEEFQIDALGPTRAQLFREGGLSAESFGRLNIGRNFEPMTLDEMRKKEPTAFKRAGL